jgi:hypothetical protein
MVFFVCWKKAVIGQATDYCYIYKASVSKNPNQWQTTNSNSAAWWSMSTDEFVLAGTSQIIRETNTSYITADIKQSQSAQI